MLNGRNLCLDTMAEVYDMLKPWIDHEFWNLGDHDIVPNSIYVLGRQQVVEWKDRVRDMCQNPSIQVVFANSAEGSQTLIDQCDRVLGLTDLIQTGRLLLISGGALPGHYPSLLHEHFLVRVLDYDENHLAVAQAQEIYRRASKPYKFLFLNGRARPHRRYLLQVLDQRGVLEHGLWTMLDGRCVDMKDFSGDPGNHVIRHLPSAYEFFKYRSFTRTDEYPHQFIKSSLFAGEWGDIYLSAEPYIDTYFSLVTETVYALPYSFRTEKIAKPLAMGHPWICAANPGFYRDLRNLGFRTFQDIIDESFDKIENHQDRMDRIADLVTDICSQDLAAFLREAEPICKYNQQFLPEFIREHRKDFPGRFQQFIQSHARS